MKELLSNIGTGGGAPAVGGGAAPSAAAGGATTEAPKEEEKKEEEKEDSDDDMVRLHHKYLTLTTNWTNCHWHGAGLRAIRLICFPAVYGSSLHPFAYAPPRAVFVHYPSCVLRSSKVTLKTSC